MRRRRTKHGKPKNLRPKSEPSFKLFRHPLSAAEPAAVREAFLKMAERKTEEFPTLIERILQGFREKYPPHILAVMAGYGLTAPVSDAGLSAKRLTSKIEQHHIELLQALMLMLPISEWGEQPASPADIQKAIDSIVDLADAFFARRFKAVEDAPDLQARTVLGLQERLRLHTQMVRNLAISPKSCRSHPSFMHPWMRRFARLLALAHPISSLRADISSGCSKIAIPRTSSG